MKIPKELKTMVILRDHSEVTMTDEAYASQTYVGRLTEATAKIQDAYGSVPLDVDVKHDDDCPMLLGDGSCKCNPDLVFRLGGPSGRIIAKSTNGILSVK